MNTTPDVTGAGGECAEGTMENGQPREWLVDAIKCFRAGGTVADAAISGVPAGRDEFADVLPATLRLANFRLSLTGTKRSAGKTGGHRAVQLHPATHPNGHQR
jgi:hypothetical protein